MTKKPSPLSSKPASKTAAGGKDVENDDTPDLKAMGRFRALAKKVVAASPEAIRRLEAKKGPSRD